MNTGIPSNNKQDLYLGMCEEFTLADFTCEILLFNGAWTGSSLNARYVLEHG